MNRRELNDTLKLIWICWLVYALSSCVSFIGLGVFRWCWMVFVVSLNLCSPCGGHLLLRICCSSSLLCLNSTFCLVSHVLTRMTHVTSCLHAPSCTSMCACVNLAESSNEWVGGGGDRKIGWVEVNQAMESMWSQCGEFVMSSWSRCRGILDVQWRCAEGVAGWR